MYTLKSIVQRGTLFGASAALVVAAIAPAVSVFADALNPLTERSLLLTSSAPGYQDTDGAGYSEAAGNPVGNGNTGSTPIPNHYAPAGSGPNGKKTGQTFTFKTSTLPSALVKGFSLQYCTSAAGYCQAPGNNAGDARALDPTTDAGEPGYNVNDPSTWGDPSGWDALTPNRDDNATAHALSTPTSDLDFVGAFTYSATPNQPGTFHVRIAGAPSTETWAFAKTTLESPFHSGAHTGKNNYVTLVSTTGETIPGGTEVQIIFTPSESIHITNPGADEFFVKINTYSSDTNLIGSHNDTTPHDNSDNTGHTVVDGGVTVANVMTDSIHITTKVLETMSFSVGTRNPDTVTKGAWNDHGTCEKIDQLDNNRLQLGNPSAEFSLETSRTWAQHSYWRLSSNSSGGATVYYSGNTLANTVGDEIADMDTVGYSQPGTEQFGLGFVDAGTDTMSSTFNTALGQPDSRYKVPTSYPFITIATQTGTGNFAGLDPQSASDDYSTYGDGYYGEGGTAGTTGNSMFRFSKTSQMVPEMIAQQNETVISCATAKMRYIANIGADTPAGVYTTKINYLAAPQY